MLKKTLSKSRLSPETLDKVKIGVMLRESEFQDKIKIITFQFLFTVFIIEGVLLNGKLHLCVSYLGDCANCCAAVTASSVLLTTMGTLLQPGCFKTRSNCRTVRSTVARVQRSTLLITMKMGTFSAMARPRCSRVVPAGKE